MAGRVPRGAGANHFLSSLNSFISCQYLFLGRSVVGFTSFVFPTPWLLHEQSPVYLFKRLLLLRTPFETFLLPSHLIERSYDLNVIQNMDSPKTHSTEENMSLLLAGWWGHSCNFLDHIHWNLMICHFIPKNLYSWAGPLILLYGNTSLQGDMNYFLPFSKLPQLFCPT